MTTLSIPTGKLDERFWSKTKPGGPDGTCIEWQRGRTKKGYGQFWHGGRTRLAHRVAYEDRFQVVLTPDEVILHKCDNPRCVNPDHHKVGTVLENNEDKLIKGRQTKGSAVAGSKLTEQQVEEIRERLKTEGVRAIARSLGVNHSTISRLKTGKNWTHV